MEREREGDQMMARRRVMSGPNPADQRTARVPRTSPNTGASSSTAFPHPAAASSYPQAPSLPPLPPLTRVEEDASGFDSTQRAPASGSSARMRRPGAASAPGRSGSFSGPRRTLVSRPTRQIPAIDGYDDYDGYDDDDGHRDTLPELRATRPEVALTPIKPSDAQPPAPVIVAPGPSRSLSARITPRREPTIKPWARWTAVAVAVIACIVGVLGFQLIHPSQLASTTVGTNVTINGVPQPSGRGPISATIGAVVAIPAPKSQHNAQTQYTDGPTYNGSLTVYGLTSIEPCHDTYQFVPNISQWTTPPGCYANIYKPNPANYPVRASWGWCNWWVEESHPQDPNITGATSYPRGTTPVANAAIFIDGGEQGASAEGHWAESVAVSPDGYWILISEMNFAWRGGGWGLVDYRYIHVSPHVHFLYGV